MKLKRLLLLLALLLVVIVFSGISLRVDHNQVYTIDDSNDCIMLIYGNRVFVSGNYPGEIDDIPLAGYWLEPEYLSDLSKVVECSIDRTHSYDNNEVMYIYLGTGDLYMYEYFGPYSPPG